MSKSVIACTIDMEESAIVRLKTSSGSGYILSACKTVPYGVDDLVSGKGNRLLKKLDEYIREWKHEELALCLSPAMYLPLPACFPIGASPEECQEYCKIEAGYFLTTPEQYRCDCLEYGRSNGHETYEKRLLLFYPAEPYRTVSGHFSADHRIVFSGTPQRPLLHLSRFSGKPQVILELERHYILLTISSNGQMEQFSCRQVKNREEAEYFAIRELVNNPICRDVEVQVAGARANKATTTLIGRETSVTLKPISIPQSLFISNPHHFKIFSATAVKAISAALMALEE